MDVVVAPDFHGSHSHIQEAQSLLFLASWMEHQTASRRTALHLACIGEPPRSVQRLAERADARISVHCPIGIHPRHHVGNKLRGLEVASDADSLLLLDVDTLLLSDISRLADWSDSLAAAPDDCPKVSRSEWGRICRGLDLPLPDERATCLAGDLGLPGSPHKLLGYKVPLDHCEDSPPYFNSGVLLVPRGCDLRALWEHSIAQIRSLFPVRDGELKWIHRSDQAGLAVSIQTLRERGWDFRRLPTGINARWRNLYAGTPSLDDIKILHLTTFLHNLAPAPLTADGLLEGVRQYLHGKLRRRFGRLMLAEMWHGRVASSASRFRNARRLCTRLDAYIERLIESHVRPVLS